MLYNLLYPLSVDYSVLNIFKYITFRSAWALVTALAVSILVGPYFIRWLQAIKCRQEILKEVKAHQCKAGTPTMGGLLIVFAVSVSVLLWADLTNAYVWMTMLVFIGFSAVGFIDDFMKVSHHQNKGLSRARNLPVRCWWPGSPCSCWCRNRPIPHGWRSRSSRP